MCNTGFNIMYRLYLCITYITKFLSKSFQILTTKICLKTDNKNFKKAILYMSTKPLLRMSETVLQPILICRSIAIFKTTVFGIYIIYVI